MNIYSYVSKIKRYLSDYQQTKTNKYAKTTITLSLKKQNHLFLPRPEKGEKRKSKKDGEKRKGKTKKQTREENKMEDNLFECTVLHEETVKKVKETMPEDGIIYDLAELFKVFADSTRMKIIYALLKEELCVCDIASIVQTTQSAISHQLRILKQTKLVKYRKEGKVVYYSLDDDHIAEIVKKGREHIDEL